MRLFIDSREQEPLKFVETDGVEIVTRSLPIGDYAAEYEDGSTSRSVVERKSLADLFSSFSGGYDAERAKIIRAKEAHLNYILAIEEPFTQVRKGCTFTKDGLVHEIGKGGLAQVKQLMTICHKYNIEVHYFSGRYEMAFWIMQWFLAEERFYAADESR